MATNNTTTTTTPPFTPPEQTPLNIEKDVAKVESGTAPRVKVADQEKVDEIKEKLKKPTIGLSLAIFLILNTIMFFVGVTTTKECPIKPIIPIYLAVAGALGIVTKLITIGNRNRRLIILDRIVYGLLIVEFIWMILGSVWIYGIYKPNYDPLLGDYCHKTAYLLAFWLLTLHYISLMLMILVPCCIFCGCLCFAGVLAAYCSETTE